MPIATPEIYAQMLDTAKANGFAFPAINVSSSQTLNAALKGFADAGSDGIIQVSTGGAEYFSGPSIENMVTGSVAFAAYAAEVAKAYPINVALHTDHCPKGKLDGFVRPLLDISAERVAAGKLPLFQSHMWDGSAVPLAENLSIAEQLLADCAAAKVILEIEVGVVGGEEDGVVGAIDEKLYTTVEDGLATAEALGLGEKGALPDGADLRQRARRLQAGQRQAASRDPQGGPGRGRPEAVWMPGAALRPGVPRWLRIGAGGDRGAALNYGVIKMNVDTDTQYAFTRPSPATCSANYDGVLKVDGEVGDRRPYDPRAWGKVGEAGMAARVGPDRT